MFKKAGSANNITYFTLAPLEQIDIIVHGFSTRLTENHAVDKGGYEQVRNRSCLCEALGINPDKLIVGRQVHGNKVAVVRKKMEGITADAFITDQPDLALAVLTADCLPIIMVDKNHPSIGIVHAGRQGTLLSVAGHALTYMARLFKADPQDCFIGIGPGIGPCCYEIPTDLARPFQESFDYWEKFLWKRRDGFFVLDLVKANQLQLMELGVKEENIFTLALCTCCNPDLFYSYRREKGDHHRLLNLIMLRNLTLSHYTGDKPPTLHEHYCSVGPCVRKKGNHFSNLTMSR